MDMTDNPCIQVVKDENVNLKEDDGGMRMSVVLSQ